MASKAEAQQLTGELLRIIPIGQAMQSQDEARMGEAYDEVHAELENIGLPVWEKTEEMPDEITPHFIHLMAFNKLNLYPASDTLRLFIQQTVGPEGNTSKDQIKALMREAYCNVDEPTDY